MSRPIGTLRVGGRAFAAGLFWQTAESAGRAQTDARQLASEPGIEADLYCLRKTETVQFGLGQSEAGHKPGMPSAAAILADRLQGTWIGVFRADGGFLYCAVRRGTIMPDGDALYGDEDSAKERLRSDLSVGGWDAVYAPAAWGIQTSTASSIEQLLSDIPKTAAKLAPVKVPVGNYVVFFLLLAGIAALGWFLLQEDESPIVSAPPPPPPPPPWFNQVAADDVLRACAAAMVPVPPRPGYDPGEITCTPQGANHQFRRRQGFPPESPPPPWALVDGDTIVYNAALPADLPKQPQALQPLERRAVRELVFIETSKVGLRPTVTDQPKPTPNPSLPPESQTLFGSVDFTIEGQVPPGVLANIFDQVPASTLDSVSYTPSTRAFTYRGKIYVKD